MSSHPASTLTSQQVFQGLCWPQDRLTGATAPVMPSNEVQLKTTALLQVLHTLSAADSGWPADKPQTSTTLLPYVADEVEELLEVLQSSAIAASSAGSDQPLANVTREPSPRRLADLSADWLWAIAASSPLAMQLLEGVAASIQDWPKVHGIRLIPTLEMQTPDATYILDLTTQGWGSRTPAFASEALLQLLDLPTAPSLTVATLQTQILHHSSVLLPALSAWFAGLPVHLCLPSTPWTLAQARLILQLAPLTIQVAEPASSMVEVALSSSEVNGLPTARVWQAESPPSAVVDTLTATLERPSQTPPWTLESDIHFLNIEALTPAMRTLHQQVLSRQVAAYGQSPTAMSPLVLLETVLSDLPAADMVGLTVGATSLSLLELCHQVKWLWIQASPEYMQLISGQPVQRLRSGYPWQSGTLFVQGRLVLSADDYPVATLDVAAAEWLIPDPNLDPADRLQLTVAAEPGIAVWGVDQLTQTIHQTVTARSPLLASLTAPQPIKLWSPQDDLFPERTLPELYLHWQLGLTFFPQ
ncbi:MAG: hypothetical protein AAGD09_23295 [Cyanobacteria bacterium P01_F01_bin.56]